MSNSELTGSSTKFRAVFEMDSAVLIRAKPAPARKMIAQAIHEASSRRNNPFVSLNCADSDLRDSRSSLNSRDSRGE